MQSGLRAQQLREQEAAAAAAQYYDNSGCAVIAHLAMHGGPCMHISALNRVNVFIILFIIMYSGTGAEAATTMFGRMLRDRYPILPQTRG